MLSTTKLFTSLLFLLPSLAIGGKAPLIPSNPKGVVAIADFPFGYDLDVTGNIVFTAKGGKSVNVHVDMTALPSEGGPFLYHIHDKSVPSEGNCELVGSHLNPYNGSSKCSEQKSDAYCEIGDLSGKHGTINDTSFEVTYDDPYLSFNENSKSYIIGKSIAFHYANLTRFACADIELAGTLRLHNLLEEYADSGNSDLDDLIQDLTSPDTFEEDEGLLREKIEDEEDLPKEKIEDEERLPKEKIEDEESLPKEKIEEERLPKEKIEDEERLPKEKIEDEESLPKEKIEDEESLPKEKIEDEVSLPKEKIEDEERLPKEKIEDEESLPKEKVKGEEGTDDRKDNKDVEENNYSGVETIASRPKPNYNHSNLTNDSKYHLNSTYNFYSDEYENGSSLKSFAFTAGLAGLIGLLI